MKLPPGESVGGWFHAMDKAGRVPIDSVLAEYIGTDWGLADHSGYRLTCHPADDSEANVRRMTAAGLRVPVSVGEMIPAAALERFAVRAVVKSRHLTFAVFSPIKGKL